MNPADLIRWHDSAMTDPSPPSMDLVRARGIVYGKKCPALKPLPAESKAERLKRAGKPRKAKRCGSTTRHYSSARKIYVCGHCGADWPAVEKLMLRGEITETALRSDGPERKLARVATVGTLLRRLSETADPVAVTVYLASVRGLGRRQIAEQGAALWPTLDFVWSERRVRDKIAEGGRAWRKVLRQAHMLAEDES